MGLDMYLDKYPKIGMSPEMINAIESFFEWKEKGKDSQCTLEEWCGIKESDLPIKEVIDFCKNFYHDSYYAWDTEHRHPYKMIHENVAYWRKANAVHGWIKRHVGMDRDVENCDFYKISEDNLRALKSDCEYVLSNAKLVRGEVTNGYRCTRSGFEPILEDGLIVDNPHVCSDVLPTEDGFFFGNTEYDEWYLDGISYTRDVCEKILEETDFSKYDLYYYASW